MAEHRRAITLLEGREPATSQAQGLGDLEKLPRQQHTEPRGMNGGISVGLVSFAVDASGHLYPVSGETDIKPRDDGTHLHPSDDTGEPAARPRIQNGTRIVIY